MRLLTRIRGEHGREGATVRKVDRKSERKKVEEKKERKKREKRRKILETGSSQRGTLFFHLVTTVIKKMREDGKEESEITRLTCRTDCYRGPAASHPSSVSASLAGPATSPFLLCKAPGSSTKKEYEMKERYPLSFPPRNNTINEKKNLFS